MIDINETATKAPTGDDLSGVALYPRGRRSIEERMAEAGDAAMPQVTLDAVDYWTVCPDEPENFAAQYPAAPVGGAA